MSNAAHSGMNYTGFPHSSAGEPYSNKDSHVFSGSELSLLLPLPCTPTPPPTPDPLSLSSTPPPAILWAHEGPATFALLFQAYYPLSFKSFKPQPLQPHLFRGSPSRLSFLSSCQLVPAPLSTPLCEGTVGAPRARDEVTWALRRPLRNLWVPER